ncbi:hypothetical protein DPMN_111764 [Dreissena polymorpha]|uniref:Uncharacterized protein n=1 Tax=Dreissena polymorpha TaxID=45954 RepID=A0A9D4KEV9_DREPO|nr:hypothetical protein DPMN_111764 [Dreissena polymorpha]
MHIFTNIHKTNIATLVFGPDLRCDPLQRFKHRLKIPVPIELVVVSRLVDVDSPVPNRARNGILFLNMSCKNDELF